MSQTSELWDYRRRVADIYARVRAGDGGEETWLRWREERDTLFGTHPQSAVEDRSSFDALPYFPYHPRWRVNAVFRPAEEETRLIGHSGAGSTRFLKTGELHFELEGHRHTLELLWLDSYGGGVFVPFRDSTSGHATYGGGRYLLDTAKGADLGHEGDLVVLDFNYAYHPSCVHSSNWSCPLAPPANRLDMAITAGERLPTTDPPG